MSMFNLDPETVKRLQQAGAQGLPVTPVAPVAPVTSPENQIIQQIESQRAQRQADVGLQMGQLDQADRFEQNAAQAEQAAKDSREAAQGIKQEVQDLETQNQAEEQEELQVLDAVENQKISETFKVNSKEVREGIAESLGLKPNTLDDEVLESFKNLEGVITGRIDQNNKKQVELQRKLDSGQELEGKDKLAFGMAAILPLIIGAVKGKPLQGIAAASKAISAFEQKRAQAKQQGQSELKGLENEQLELLTLSTKILDSKIGSLGKVENQKLNRAESIEKQISARLQQKGLTFQNVKDEEDAKQGILKTEQLIRDAQRDIEGGDEKSGKPVTAAQALAARFAVQTSQAEEFFGRGSIPKPGELLLPSATQSSETQQFSQAALQFVNATLRPESGAAVSIDELTKGELQYIPKFGDSKETLERKRKARIAVSAGNFALAGEDAIKSIQEQMDILNRKPLSKESGDNSFSELSDEELRAIIEGE